MTNIQKLQCISMGRKMSKKELAVDLLIRANEEKLFIGMEITPCTRIAIEKDSMRTYAYQYTVRNPEKLPKDFVSALAEMIDSGKVICTDIDANGIPKMILRESK